LAERSAATVRPVNAVAAQLLRLHRVEARVHTRAIVECRVCGAERVLGVNISESAVEVAEFAASHGTHESYGIHLRLLDHDSEGIIEQRRVGNPSLQEL
jgi:hypothetical protein